MALAEAAKGAYPVAMEVDSRAKACSMEAPGTGSSFGFGKRRHVPMAPPAL
jgi:hypothetical protein